MPLPQPAVATSAHDAAWLAFAMMRKWRAIQHLLDEEVLKQLLDEARAAEIALSLSVSQ